MAPQPWKYANDSHSIEETIGVIAANLPACKPLFSSFFEKARAFSSGDGSRSKTRGNTYKRNSALGYVRTDNSQVGIPLEQVNERRQDSIERQYQVYISSDKRGESANNAWDGESSAKSEEHILPRHHSTRTPKGILQTTDIKIN